MVDWILVFCQLTSVPNLEDGLHPLGHRELAGEPRAFRRGGRRRQHNQDQ